eukprot:scaffold814_cov398-Prasinococcus_capsulatus_cf.AAC.3
MYMLEHTGQRIHDGLAEDCSFPTIDESDMIQEQDTISVQHIFFEPHKLHGVHELYIVAAYTIEIVEHELVLSTSTTIVLVNEQPRVLVMHLDYRLSHGSSCLRSLLELKLEVPLRKRYDTSLKLHSSNRQLQRVGEELCGRSVA